MSLNTPLTWVVNATCNANGCPDYCQRTKFCKAACESHCCASDVDVLKFGRSEIEDDHDHVDAVGSCNALSVFDPTLSSTFSQKSQAFTDAIGNKSVNGMYASESITIGQEGSKSSVIKYGAFGLANIVPGDVLGGIVSGVLGFGIGPRNNYQNSDGVTAIIQDAYKQLLIMERTITLWLEKPESDNDDAQTSSGILTWGGFNHIPHCPGRIIRAGEIIKGALEMSGFAVNGNKMSKKISVSYKCLKLSMRSKFLCFVGTFLNNNVSFFVIRCKCKSIQKYKTHHADSLLGCNKREYIFACFRRPSTCQGELTFAPWKYAPRHSRQIEQIASKARKWRKGQKITRSGAQLKENSARLSRFGLHFMSHL